MCSEIEKIGINLIPPNVSFMVSVANKNGQGYLFANRITATPVFVWTLGKRDLISDIQNKITLLVPHTQGLWCSFYGDYNYNYNYNFSFFFIKGPLPLPHLPLICNWFKSCAIHDFNSIGKIDLMH